MASVKRFLSIPCRSHIIHISERNHVGHAAGMCPATLLRSFPGFQVKIAKTIITIDCTVTPAGLNQNIGAPSLIVTLFATCKKRPRRPRLAFPWTPFLLDRRPFTRRKLTSRATTPEGHGVCQRGCRTGDTWYSVSVEKLKTKVQVAARFRTWGNKISFGSGGQSHFKNGVLSCPFASSDPTYPDTH
jgi:hypothetical protein